MSKQTFGLNQYKGGSLVKKFLAFLSWGSQREPRTKIARVYRRYFLNRFVRWTKALALESDVPFHVLIRYKVTEILQQVAVKGQLSA